MRSRLCVMAILVVVATGINPALAQQKLYWTDPNLHKIMRSNLDGTTVEPIIATNEDLAYITASDSLGKIFFTIRSPTPQLWSADFLGQNRQLLATFDSANYTRGLAFS